MHTQVEQIKVKNFKLYKNLHVTNLQQFNVFLGANGSGKTTFFKVFSFLSTCLRENVTVAVNREGGFKEVLTRGCDIHKDMLEFEIKFRNFEENKTSPSPLATYELKIGFHQGKIFVESEVLKYRRGSRGQPWHFLDYSRGKGQAVKNEGDYGEPGATEEREEQPLSAEDILAIKVLW